ncbi:hypothetical protein HNQ56_003260 [Anaerotaenia torta]|uniref:hypothetical protein n=1 Tax=Anaerotaenia torta TaxID=433293 RepID=UPI003D237B1D
MYNQNFDPLSAKYLGNDEVVIKSLKREIQNILSSYVGWFDTFCELIQNGLDALDARTKLKEPDFKPMLHIIIDLKQNAVAVTDNGIGFEEQQYTKFLAPNFSFKSGNTRGHKGVGSTYLAYGFNYIQIATKAPSFTALGKMENARNWLSDENPAGNPMVIPDDSEPYDPLYNDIDRGVSVCIKYDENTNPKDLSWMKISNAENWLKVLRVKTGLGAIKANNNILVKVTVIDKNGKQTEAECQGIGYLWANEMFEKVQKYTDIKLKMDQLYRIKGDTYRLPSKYLNLNAIYDMWDYNRLQEEINIEESENKIIEQCKPIVYFCYVYSTKIWDKFSESLGLRNGINIMSGGIQIAANNMPQGELILIPLKKSAGRQFQLHVVMHFENCFADLGRKGFQKDIVDFSKSIARKMADGPLNKTKRCFRKNTGATPDDLMRQQRLDDWKVDMKAHENAKPLVFENENFFLPMKRVSITSEPTREQDVIALFNQLLAGGVIRGIKIMSTNERFTYDGLYHIIIDPPIDNHVFNDVKNPLGILKETLGELNEEYPEGICSEPKVLEYKFSLDGLIEDIESGIKNSNDINLVIAWEAGDLYKEKFYITSLLLDENIYMRQYHGVTHKLLDVTTSQVVCDLILLKDLIKYLNDPESCKIEQEEYDE